MKNPLRIRLLPNVLARVLLVAFIFSLLPPSAALASVKVEEVIDDNLATFSDGVFQRTALNSIRGTAPDVIGGIQLARAGVLKPWSRLTGELPIPLAEAGMVALGRRIFVIGGSTVGENPGELARTNRVYWADINPDNGVPIDPTNSGSDPWRRSDTTDLPPVQASLSTGCTTPVAERSNAAVAALSTGGNSGHIYVVGGNVLPPGQCITIASFGVQIGTATENGQITWRDAARIPTTRSDGITATGIEAASATVVTTSAGRSFLYVVGGLKRFRFGNAPGVPREEGSNQVFYVELDRTTGNFIGIWQEGPKLFDNTATPTRGLWNATAVAASFDVGGGGVASGQAIFVTGGQFAISPIEPNTQVYRTIIGSDGMLSDWDTSPGEGSPPSPAPIPRPLVNMAGIFYNGKIYLTGGRQPTESGPSAYRSEALTTQIGDDLSLLRPDPTSPNQFFINSDNVLPDARVNHGMAVVPATPTAQDPSAAWAFVAGGFDSEGNATKTLFIGRIGGIDESDDSRLSPNGWYISNPLDVQLSGSNVDVLEIRWTTQITRTGFTDIKLQYRVANNADAVCNRPGAFPDVWQDLDGFPGNDDFQSVSGPNKVEFPQGVNASCFQYRARFNTDVATESPSLLRVTLIKRVRGGPDLKYDSNFPPLVRNAQNQPVDLDLRILNRYDNPNGEPTLAADFDGAFLSPPQIGGQFYVDICISEPNQEPPPPPVPVGGNASGAPCAKAYAILNKANFTPGATVRATQWLNGAGQPVDILRTFMAQPGVYRVYLVIDSTNTVQEVENGGKQNNVAGIDITIDAPIGPPPTPTPTPPPSGGPPKIFLPIVSR